MKGFEPIVKSGGFGKAFIALKRERGAALAPTHRGLCHGFASRTFYAREKILSDAEKIRVRATKNKS
jgi:hypothetical protein